MRSMEGPGPSMLAGARDPTTTRYARGPPPRSGEDFYSGLGASQLSSIILMIAEKSLPPPPSAAKRP
jgi:hypothetical protein